MVVADAGTPQLGVARAGAHPQMPGARRNPHQAMEDGAHIGDGQAEIAMAALLLDIDEAGILELAEMPARRREHDARLLGELGCGERLAVHERSQHVGARRISQQRRNGRDVRSVFHSLTLAELSTRRKLLDVAVRKSKEAPMRAAAATTEAVGNAREYALLFVLAIVWGSSYAFIRLSVAPIPPWALPPRRPSTARGLLFALLSAPGYRLP